MSGANRVGELLAFDLGLAGFEAARSQSAPSLFPNAPLLHQASGLWSLAGFDEAGRGAVGGPVVVGCVQFSWHRLAGAHLGHIDDSKRLTARARDVAFAEIERRALWAVGFASAKEIDSVGIVEAAERAARRAYRRLGCSCDLAVFDRGLSMGDAVALDPSPLSSLSSLGCRDESRAKSTEPGNRVRGNESRGPGKSNGLDGPKEPDELNESPPSFPTGVAFTRGDMRSLHVAAASIVAKVTRDRLMERLDAAFPGYEFSRHKGYGTERHRLAISRLGPSPVHRRSFLHFSDRAESQSC